MLQILQSRSICGQNKYVNKLNYEEGMMQGNLIFHSFNILLTPCLYIDYSCTSIASRKETLLPGNTLQQCLWNHICCVQLFWPISHEVIPAEAQGQIRQMNLTSSTQEEWGRKGFTAALFYSSVATYWNTYTFF